MRRGTFKSTQTMHRALTESRKATKREAQKRDWTEAAHLTEQDQSEEKRYAKFISELTQISRKYGIAIKSIGGVVIADSDEFSKVEYDADSTSGDLIPIF